MKRPLMMGMLFYISGLLLEKYLSVTEYTGWIVLVLLLFEMSLFLSRETRLICYLVPVFLFPGFFVYESVSQSYVEDFEFKDDEPAKVCGNIRWIEPKNEKYKVTISDVQICYANQKIKCRKMLLYLSDKTEELNPGDRILAQGSLFNFKSSKNPGEFNLKQYYKSNQIFCGLSAEKVKVLSKNQKKWKRLLFKLRKNLCNSLNYLAPQKEASILKTMLLGEKSDMEESTKQMYQLSGASHLLCISGIHVSIIGIAVGIFFHYLLPFPKLAAFMSMLTIVLYGEMTGMGTASFRAVIMYVLLLVAGMLRRTYDMATALSIAAAIILTDNPEKIENVGMLLSFFAVLGIICVLPMLGSQELSGYLAEKRKQPLQKRKEEKSKKEPFRDHVFQCLRKLRNRMIEICLKNLLSGIAINLTTLPLILYFYYQIPMYSILLNMLILPTVSLLLVDGMCGSIVGMYSVSVGKIILLPAVKLLEFYEFLMHEMEKLPMSVVIVGRPKPWQMLLYFTGLFFMCWMIFRKKERFFETIHRKEEKKL